jgi:two-component system OmpR family response regulator
VGSLDDNSGNYQNRGFHVSQGVIHVLVVDNDPDSLTTLKLGLEEYGFKVHGFRNAFVAIQEIKKDGKNEKYDMILCDINISDNDWFVFAKQVRELNKTVKIFLMTSSEIDDIVIHNAMSAGVNEIIRKPLSIESLNIVLQNYIDGITNPLDSALKL